MCQRLKDGKLFAIRNMQIVVSYMQSSLVLTNKVTKVKNDLRKLRENEI